MGSALGGVTWGALGGALEGVFGGALRGALEKPWRCRGGCLGGLSERGGAVEKIIELKICLYGFRPRFLDGIRTVILFSLHRPSAPGLRLYGIRTRQIRATRFAKTDFEQISCTESV